MSSGFVSGGTNDAPIERDDEWKQAQTDIAEQRRQTAKEEESQGQSGKSLYETLQANKAAKQEAFEESAKLKNQFRSLNEDEVDFLDTVMESTRAKEDAVKKETSEQLELFRRQQAEAEKREAQGESQETPQEQGEEVVWTTRKRKKGKEEKGIKGLKLRKTSSTGTEERDASKPVAENAQAEDENSSMKSESGDPSINKKENAVEDAKNPTVTRQNASQPPKQAPSKYAPPGGGLGLVAYSSDEE